MDAVIRTEKLGKTYRTGFWMRPLVGLSDLDLEVYRGEIFGFVGPNGAGKTTTMKIFTGLQRATSGQAWVLGLPCEDPDSRRSVGFLPERPYFYSHLTARELLDFYGQLFTLPSALRQQRITALLDRVEMTRFADVPLGKYSKGMLQRVGLCQCLLHDPELIILDEPMSGLDPLGRALVRDLILEENKRGKTIFFSSHILSDVESLCSRVGIVVGGRLKALGSVEKLLGDHIKAVECVYADVAEALPLQGEHLPAERDRFRVRVAPDRLDETLGAIQGGGGRVLSVQSIRPSLEEILVDEIRQDQPVKIDKMGVLA